MPPKDNDIFNGQSEIFIYPNDYANCDPVSLGKTVANSLRYDKNDEDVSVPAITKGSYSFDLAARPSDKLLRRLLGIPQVKPDNLKYPNRKRAWRIKKKWFNRYQKPMEVGRVFFTQDKDGQQYAFIKTDCVLKKSGGIEYSARLCLLI